MSRVMIHPAGYENVGEAVERAFDLFPLDVTGKKVLINPNVLRASEVNEAITTHPAVVRAVVEKVETMGPAVIVVGDNPGVFSYGANEASFAKAGLIEAARGYYVNIGKESGRVDFNPAFLPEVSLSRIVLEADIIISLPKFKTHGLTLLTGAIKNCYGFLPGAQKARLHKAAGCRERFHEMIVDVFRLRVPDLFIVDAVVGMEGDGPASPDLRDIGLILASDNGVATDATIARLMGYDPGLLRFLQKAKEAGLGDYDSRTIDIVGELKPLPDFKLPAMSAELVTQSRTAEEMLHNRTLQRPQVDIKGCTGCATCVDQCPVSALTVVDGVPEVDADTCIACFCCQEICPEKAVALR